MKKARLPILVILFLAALFTFSFFTACSDWEPLVDPKVVQSSYQNSLTIQLKAASKGIDWVELQVLLLRLRLIDPLGSVQTVDVYPGSPETVILNTRMFGDHIFQAIEFMTNANGVTNVITNSAVIPMRENYNYIVTVTIGGNIIIEVTNTNSGTNTNTNTSAPASFGIYSDSVPISVLWDSDTKLDIWEDTENLIPNTLSITDQQVSTGEGANAWQIDGLSPTIYWIGFGVRVEPLNAYRDLRAFTNGSLNFLFRGTRPFKVGIKDGNGVQQWIKPLQMSSYGLRTNDSWCQIVIPLKKFDKIDFSKVQQYFMWTADTTMGYTVSRSYSIDNVYFTNHYGGAYDNYSETNFGIFSESVEQSINMNYDTELSIWTNDNGMMFMNDDASDIGEGTRSWKLTGAGAWMGFGIYAWPGDIYRDMSGYANGALRFMYKGTKAIAKIGAQSRRTDNLLWDAAVPGFDLIKYFGMKTNNTWCEVVIPIKYLVWKGLDVSRVFQYFYLAQDKGAGYTAGDVCRIDNIYWTKTPGGNMNWTTNTNLSGYGIYSETIPMEVVWDTDTILEIWNDWGGGMTVNELVGGAPEGLRYWKFTGTGAWMGMGIKHIDAGANIINMTAYANGHLKFFFKSTDTFTHIAVASEPCGNTQAKFTPAELASYGLRLDGTWSQVSIPISAITAKGVKLAEFKYYFMFVSDKANYHVGSTYYFDNIYYTKD